MAYFPLEHWIQHEYWKWIRSSHKELPLTQDVSHWIDDDYLLTQPLENYLISGKIQVGLVNIKNEKEVHWLQEE